MENHHTHTFTHHTHTHSRGLAEAFGGMKGNHTYTVTLHTRTLSWLTAFFPFGFEALAFFVAHVHPFFSPLLGFGVVGATATTFGAIEAKTAEEDAAENEQSYGLPKVDALERGDFRQGVIPQQHHDIAHQHEEQWEGEDEEPYFSFPVWFHGLIVVQFIVQGLEALAQVLHRVALARDDGF